MLLSFDTDPLDDLSLISAHGPTGLWWPLEEPSPMTAAPQSRLERWVLGVGMDDDRWVLNGGRWWGSRSKLRHTLGDWAAARASWIYRSE